METGHKRLIGKPRQLPIQLGDGTQMMAIISLGEIEHVRIFEYF